MKQLWEKFFRLGHQGHEFPHNQDHNEMQQDNRDTPIEKRVWKGPVVEVSEGLKKILPLRQKLNQLDDVCLQQPSDAPRGNWISKGFSDHHGEFIEDIELLRSVPHLLEAVLNAPYQNTDFFLLSSLWCATKRFSPDLVIEIGRSVGGTTISLIAASRNCVGLKQVVTVDVNAFWWEKTVEKYGVQIDQRRLFVVTHDARYVPWGKLLVHSRRPFIFIDAHDAPGFR